MSSGEIFFYLSGALTLVSALWVVFSPNILYAGFSLLATFAGVAGLYLSLEAAFLAVVQLLVYVGGITVLILFAVMLSRELAQGRLFQEEFRETRGGWFAFLTASLTGGILLAFFLWVIQKTPWKLVEWEVVDSARGLGLLFLKDYLLAFEFSSITLLGALIGAAVLSRPKKDAGS